MPELPEVETIKRYLSKSLVGKKIAAVKILEKKQFIGDPKQVIGAKVEKVFRRAKTLGLILDNNLTLLFHLKLTGQIVFFANHRLKEELVLSSPLPLPIISYRGKLLGLLLSLSMGVGFFLTICASLVG